MSSLSHVNEDGNPRMVDVSGKAKSARRAIAEGYVLLKPGHIEALDQLPKGDAITVAQIAGIQGGKRCSELIPLCHSLSLSSLDVEVVVDPPAGEVTVVATARTTDRTGVEMEALTAASVGALTVYDMVKGIERGVVIEELRLLEKTGGRSGDWRA